MPEEIQEQILDELSVEDLVACSSVCKQWKNGVNSSAVWKKWCLLKSYEPELMESSAPAISPKFLDELGPPIVQKALGLWRMTYEWHERVKLHWKKENIMMRVKLPNSNGKVVGFHTNGDRLAVVEENSSVAVWSIKPTIPIMVARLAAVLQGHPILSVRIDKDFVIVVQRKLLQVFHRQNQKYFLTGLKCFELRGSNENLLNSFEKQGPRFSQWYEECLRVNGPTLADSVPTGPVMYDIFGDTLFATLSYGSEVRSWSLPGCQAISRIDGFPTILQIMSDVSGVYLAVCDSMTRLLKFVPSKKNFEEQLTVPGLKTFAVGCGLVVAYPSPGDVAVKKIRAFWGGLHGSEFWKSREVADLVSASICMPHHVIYIENQRLVHLWDPIVDHDLAILLVKGWPYHSQIIFSTYILVLRETSLLLCDWQKRRRLYSVQKMLNEKTAVGYPVWADLTRMIICGNGRIEILSFI